MDLREPIGWVAQNPRMAVSRPGPFRACIMVGEREIHAPAEFPDAESAVAWARERAEIVVIRPAGFQDYLSASERQPPWERPLDRWPVDPADVTSNRRPRERGAGPAKVIRWVGASGSGEVTGWTEFSRLDEHVLPMDDDAEVQADAAGYSPGPVETSDCLPFPSWDMDQEGLWE